MDKIPGIHTQKEAETAAYNYTECIGQLKAKYAPNYVCNFQIYKSEDGLFTNWCTWTNFMASVMPKTDYVAIVLLNLYYSDVYKITQVDLIKSIGDDITHNYDPVEHFALPSLENKPDKTNIVLDNSTYINRQQYFPHIAGDNVPATAKYFVKLWLYSKNALGDSVILFFHQAPSTKNLSDIQYYASKVNPGETLENVLHKEVLSITRSEKYTIRSIIDDDTASDRYGNEIKRYAVLLDVPFFETQGKQMGGLNMSWCPVSQLSDELEESRYL